MKRKGTFTLQTLEDQIAAVSTGEDNGFRGIVKLNETGLVLWNMLESEVTADEMAEKLTEEYDIDIDTARQDVLNFIDILEEKNLID